MMNRSRIDWCDFSWNPITGCQHGCSYCYAQKQAQRFCGDVRLNKHSRQLQRHGDLWVLDESFKNVNDKIIPLPVGFEPTLHRYRMEMPQKKKLPANIFVGSMADIFGDWVPDEWIAEVFKACKAAPWHNYLFLTKNPQRYNELLSEGLLPVTDNFWYGGTRTGVDSDREHETSMHGHTFLSIEPIHGPVEDATLNALDCWDWVIIGAETGNRKDKVIPERSWIGDILEAAAVAEVPVFMKSNLASVWDEPLIQEFPEKLITHSWENRPVHKVFVECVRDKKKCRQCGKSVQNKPAYRISARYYICEKCYKGELTDEMRRDD